MTMIFLFWKLLDSSRNCPTSGKCKSELLVGIHAALDWKEGGRDEFFIVEYCSTRNHFFNVSLMKLKEFPVGWSGTVKPH